MRARLIAAGINASVVDTVGEMTTQRVAAITLPTERLNRGTAVLRTRIQLLVKHLTAWVIELDDGLPLPGILGTSTKLTRLLHQPSEVQSMRVRVQYAFRSIPQRFLSVRGIGDIVDVLVSIFEVDARGFWRKAVESTQQL